MEPIDPYDPNTAPKWVQNGAGVLAAIVIGAVILGVVVLVVALLLGALRWALGV